MGCTHCQHKFTEELDFIRKRRLHNKRFISGIIEEVLNSDIRSGCQKK